MHNCPADPNKDTLLQRTLKSPSVPWFASAAKPLLQTLPTGTPGSTRTWLWRCVANDLLRPGETWYEEAVFQVTLAEKHVPVDQDISTEQPQNVGRPRATRPPQNDAQAPFRDSQALSGT
ncbi:hypothetical protein FZEAL_5295 [Fusarium zealandicum]|uniref:Uncharacterized protein n=1 Tax=Fusarium zealandicum TaxID=1053134 RepID=A0A8H4XKK9_9HYPO|nr:hypothetical protein FZEAL_5295 [Fusarium zealandicum]